MNKETEEAVNAHTNLNLFSLIKTMLESGHIYGGDNTAAKKIIAICNKETQRQLKKFDAAIAASKKDAP